MKAKGLRFIILPFAICYFLFAILGCDAFVRKFTRKPKKERLIKEEVIVSPQEYKEVKLSKEESYRQYFLFWSSWQEELIVSLAGEANRKKQLSCAAEAIKNLLSLKPLLKEEEQRKLDIYIGQMNKLKGAIEDDLFGSSYSSNRLAAERIKRGIIREFSYNKIKDYLL